MVDIFHYNDRNRTYKALRVEPVDDNSGVFISLSTGTKQDAESRNRISMKLNKSELAYLYLSLGRMFNKIEE